MKFKSNLALFLIILCGISILVTFTTSRKFRKQVPVDKTYYRFYWGLVTRLLPKNEKNKESCLPSSWVGKDIAKDDSANIVASLTAIQAVLSKTTIALSKKIEKPCKDIPSIVEYMNKKLHRRPKKKGPSRRRRYNFIEMQISKKHHRRRAVPSYADMQPFESISIYFQDIKNALSGFFTMPFMEQCKSIITCLPDKYPDVKGLKDIAENTIENMKKISTDEDKSIETIIGTICNWHKLKRSIHFLNASFLQGNELTRWQSLGYFFGRLLTALSYN